MNLYNILSVTVLGFVLAGCNGSGIQPHNADTVVTAETYNKVTVYTPRLTPPKTKLVGTVIAQNKFANGMKATPEEIMTELKRQAFALGANGLIHVTPGAAQTTADAVVVLR
jgi:uncharacterized protein YbjQ (UPF0145 family)